MTTKHTKTTLPLDLAPLREEAERSAREHTLAWADAYCEQFDEVRGPDSEYITPDSEVRTQACLLADLTRTASFDFWIRWLAEDVGIIPWHTPPRWMIYGSGWLLISDDGKEKKEFSFAELGVASANDARVLKAAVMLRAQR